MSYRYQQGRATAPTKAALSSDTDLINITEARSILGISANKMASLISSGTLRYEQDPLDHRVKLVNRKDVESLMRKRNHGT